MAEKREAGRAKHKEEISCSRKDGTLTISGPAGEVLLEENARLGFDGWMADFGEYVRPDAVTSIGESGLIHHNRFPLP